MAKVTSGWKGGTPRQLGQRITQRGEAIKAGAIEALELSIEEGAIATQDFLEDAVTRTGLERQESRGGFPGRHDTGNMVGSISYEVRERRSKVIWGVFGWLGADFERYFREQDDPGFGPGNIPPARALPRAYVIARERLRERLEALMYRGESPHR